MIIKYDSLKTVKILMKIDRDIAKTKLTFLPATKIAI